MISFFSGKQTEILKIIIESKIALDIQQNLGLLEQQISLLIAMDFLFLRFANFSSNHNVDLHACSPRPPWSRVLITLHWQGIYALNQLEVSIYKVMHNEKFTLHKVSYLNHFTFHGSSYYKRSAESLCPQTTQGFSLGFYVYGCWATVLALKL